MKNVSIDQLKNINLSEYNNRDIVNASELAAKISEFYPAEVKVRISEQDGKQYFEAVNIFLIHPLEIRVQLIKNKYHFYAWKLHELKNVNYSDKNSIGTNIGEPQQIGVLSTKKINAWVAYYEKVYEAMKAKNNETLDKIQAFRNSLKGLPVHWYGMQDEKQNRGSIELGGLLFEFTIEDDYISKNITVAHGHGNTLENFLKMADNKL